MSQDIAAERAKIAALREAVRVTASDPPMAGIRLMMSAEDVAAIMPNATADTVRDKHRQWTQKNGFPAPIPGMAPLVWSGPQIMAWLVGNPNLPLEYGAAVAGSHVAVTDLARYYGGAQ